MESEDEAYSSGEEGLGGGGGGGQDVVEFGWAEQRKELSGRRLKQMKEKKKKMKTGTFGKCRLHAGSA